VPAVAVGKVQEYAVAIAGLFGVESGLIFVQLTVVPTGFVTVHAIVPPGFAPATPVTIAVRDPVPPSVGALAEAMVIVGTRFDTPIESELEFAAR